LGAPEPAAADPVRAAAGHPSGIPHAGIDQDLCECPVRGVLLDGLSSTPAVIATPAVASLLGAMRDGSWPPPRTQGGRHGQSIRPPPRAAVPETHPRAAPCSAPPAGAQSPSGPPPAPTGS